MLIYADKWRALQNIGGIGNVSFIPPKGVEADPLAFDTGLQHEFMALTTSTDMMHHAGPGNVLMDWCCVLSSQGEMKYDADGKLGRQGKVYTPLLNGLLAHPYLSLVPPKSTGRELYTKEYAEEIFQRAQKESISVYEPNISHHFSFMLRNDILATLTEFTAMSIVQSYIKWAPGKIGEVYLVPSSN